MLRHAGFVGNQTQRLIDAIRSLGMATSLQCCVDAGDSNSYTTGQTLTDVSGAGTHFTRGNSSSAAGDDPTFVGTAGTLIPSATFSFDGGDNFVLSSANPTWANNLHKDNATYTLFVWFKYIASASAQYLISTYNDSSQTGINFGVNPTSTTDDSAESFFLNIRNSGSLVSGVNISSISPLVNGQYYCIAMSMNETSTTGRLGFSNGLFSQAASAVYTSPSTNSASAKLSLFGTENGSNRVANGTLFGCAAIWSRALTNTELSALYEATRDRFGLPATPPTTIRPLASTTSATNGTTHTFSALNSGVPLTGAKVAVAFGARLNAAGTPTVSSVTIGGTAASLVLAGTNTTARQGVYIYWADYSAAYLADPTLNSQTMDVVVTFSATVEHCSLDLYRLYGLQSTSAAFGTLTDNDASNPLSGSLSYSQGGATIAIAASPAATYHDSGGKDPHDVADPNWTWTNLTKYSDQAADIDGGGTNARSYSTAYTWHSAATGSVTVTANSLTAEAVMIAASFR